MSADDSLGGVLPWVRLAGAVRAGISLECSCCLRLQEEGYLASPDQRPDIFLCDACARALARLVGTTLAQQRKEARR